MATMRAQAVDMIYRLPDKEVLAVIKHLQDILNSVEEKDYGNKTNDEKNMAFERLEHWRKTNKEFFGTDFDWKKEVQEALNEKYGLAD